MTTTSSSRAHRLGRRSVLTIALGAALIVPSIILAAPSDAVPITETFNLTGGEQAFVVPAGVSSIDVVATGGHGSSGTSASPGRAARVTASIPVTAGQTLYVNVGGNGSGSNARFNGGGLGVGAGGGASDVRTVSRINGSDSLDSRVLVAAGGGGAGAFDAPGGNAGANGSDSDALGCDGGQAGTSTEGGASGGGDGGAGDGSLGQGGDGGNTQFGRLGGGGGGGLYGGGGGGSIFIGAGGCGAGGGGGSNLVPSGGGSTLAAAGSTPQITFTYEILETTAPSLSGLSAVPGQVPAGATVTVSATADDTGGTGIASAEYAVDGGAWTAMNAADGAFDEAVEGITAGIDTTSLSQESHEVCVRATDEAGNQTPTPLCTTFTVGPPDTTAPEVSFLNATPSPVAAGVDVTLSAEADDAGGIDSAEYSIDGGAWTVMDATDGGFGETSESVTADVDTTSLSVGSHDFCVRATDASGNVTTTPPCSSFIVDEPDTIAPTVSDLVATPNPVNIGGIVTLTASVDDLGSSGIESVEFALDGGSWTAAEAVDGAFDENAENVTADLVTASLSLGDHEFCMRATDASGNVTPTPPCTTFVVNPPDDTPPVVSDLAVTPGTASVGDPVRLTATATDDSNIASAFYLVDGDPLSDLSAEDGAFDEPSEDLEAANISTTSFAPGERTLCLVVTDAAGNQSDGTDCVTLTLSAADDGDGDGDGDDGDDDGGSSDGAADDDENDGDDSTLPDTGASDASLAYALGGLVAIAVGGFILTQTTMRPRHRA